MNSLTEKEISEIRSLVKLIDDEEEVFLIARSKLLEYQEAALPYLLTDISQSFSPQFQKRKDQIVELIQRTKLRNAIENMSQDPQGDLYLEEACYILSRYQNPFVDIPRYRNIIQEHSKELKAEISTVIDPMDIFFKIVNYFVATKRYKGNKENYYARENQYINTVIETKLGIPITLSAIYLIVCRKINLPIYGIGLPGHFILSYHNANENVFFDPYNDGKIISQDECRHIVESLGYKFTEDFLDIVTNKQIFERMLRNLVVCFEREQQSEKIETIRLCIDTLNSDV